MTRFTVVPSPRLAGALAVSLLLSMAILGWLGYRAIRESQQSAIQLAHRRAQQSADLLATTLARDMRAVQSSILSSNDWNDAMLEPPYDVTQLVATAFARYPYPEAFFAWRSGRPSDSVFFSRADRPPTWLTAPRARVAFPVLIAREPLIANALFDRIGAEAKREHRFAIFNLPIKDSTYQVVARLHYGDAFRHRLDAVFGFMVNLDWAKQHYLQDFAKEVERIAGTDASVVLTIMDDDQGSADASGKVVPVGRRPFSLTFFDPLSLALNAAGDFGSDLWIAQAEVVPDTLGAATIGSSRTLWITVLAGLVFVVGLALTVNGVRVNTSLVRRRADFVSSVTHELKTPVAAIRAAGETVLSGRLTDNDAPREYARLVVEHAKRLARLVDNLLAYSRITDVTEGYSFEPVNMRELVNDSLRDFRWQLQSGGFEVAIHLPEDLPPLWGDRTALGLLLSNLVDNAIRYSRDSRQITISAAQAGHTVRFEVVDRGIGIPSNELGHVTRKFFRGKRSGSGGSGLGLAIAERIVIDHHGSLFIESDPEGVGTKVSVVIPAEGLSRPIVSWFRNKRES
jgi:signal transduction histidine kinase